MRASDNKTSDNKETMVSEGNATQGKSMQMDIHTCLGRVLQLQEGLANYLVKNTINDGHRGIKRLSTEINSSSPPSKDRLGV
jgi:hypothetical protein